MCPGPPAALGCIGPRPDGHREFRGYLAAEHLSEQLSAVTVDEGAVGEQAVDILSQMARGKLSIDHERRWIMELGFHEGSTIAEPLPSMLFSY